MLILKFGSRNLFFSLSNILSDTGHFSKPQIAETLIGTAFLFGILLETKTAN